jgi:hypothetical protein
MNSIRKAAAGAAIVATAVAGGAIGASLLGSAGAQTAGSSSTTAPAQTGGAPDGAPGRQFDPAQGGHVGQNGQKEVLLTGDTADKVKAAAQAAVPGATIERVETDAEGSPYEAHMVKSDGSHVTVKVDSNFKVSNIENDGAGPGGHGGPPPAQSGGTTPTTTS